MSYFDGSNIENPVIFRYGTVTGNEGTTAPYPNYMTGGISYNIASFASGAAVDGSAQGAQVVADNASTHKGGVYTAVGSLSSGRALIAWNDEVNGQLVYSYSSGEAESALLNTPTSDWQSNAKVVDSGDFAGWYVDMVVDSDNGIHLAWYNGGNGDVRYVHLENYDETEAQIQAKVVTVDSYLSAGARLMLNVRKETRLVNNVSTLVQVPYISYYHVTFTGSKNSVRVAWKDDFDAIRDGAANEQFTGAWEVMTVPTNGVPADDYICNGVPTSGTFNKNGLSMTNTVLLGYITNQRYEYAYIKK
jgi:hypothetical protein